MPHSLGATGTFERAVTTRAPLSSLAMLAIVGQLTLTTTAWLLPVVSEYGLMRDTISELVLSRYGLVQTAAFVLAGVGTLGLAFAVRVLTTKSRGAAVGSLLLAIWGAGAILSAIFPTDRIDRAADVWSQSPTGTIHVLVSLVSFPAVIVGMFVLTSTFRRDPRWRPLVPWWSGSFAGSALALFVVQGEGPIGGLLQRLLVMVISGWLILVALRVRALAGRDDRTRDQALATYPAWIVWLVCMAVVLALVWLLVESVEPDPKVVGARSSSSETDVSKLVAEVAALQNHGAETDQDDRDLRDPSHPGQ